MRFTYDDYKNKRCTGIEYVRSQFIGEDGKGNVVAYKIFGTHYLYAIQRMTTKWKNEVEVKCNELKLYDIDNPTNSCLEKRNQFFGPLITAQEFMEDCLSDPEIRNYIESRCIYNDY